MSQSDELKSGEAELVAELLNESEEEELQAKIDDAEEPFDPEQPADLATTADKQAAAEDEEGDGESINSENCTESGDEEESDDSIVNDKVEYLCKDHEFCVAYAKEVDAFLLRTLSARTGGRERQAALAEVLCDHFERK